MSITVLRDLNDDPCDTRTWRAAACHCPNPFGSNRQSWAVVWGSCYADMMSGVRPLGWSEEQNTDEDGALWFDSEEAALAYLAEVEEAGRV